MTEEDISALLGRIRFKQIAPHFSQYYLGDGWALHRHVNVDGSDPHDHPHDLRSHVLSDKHLPPEAQGRSGGYTEEVFTQNPDGAWARKLIHHPVGDEFGFPAAHVHRVVKLDKEECWTLVRFSPEETPWRHYPEALEE